jgi:hypothetical protein
MRRRPAGRYWQFKKSLNIVQKVCILLSMPRAGLSGNPPKGRPADTSDGGRSLFALCVPLVWEPRECGERSA